MVSNFLLLLSLSLLSLLFFIDVSQSYNLKTHPLESRILYVYGFKNIHAINKENKEVLQTLFKKHPLMIFKGLDQVSPKEFLNFVKQFDPDRDEAALEKPEEKHTQMLQPFDQFPDCNHVAPRGNVELRDFYNIKEIKITPYDAFVNNYVWHTDILGHDYKMPNVITGFYIIEQPQIGGDTDFISGETIYEHLSPEEQVASKNILMEINRRKFVTNTLKIDYAGICRSEEYVEGVEGGNQLPLVTAPDDPTENFRVLLQPTFFEKVVGWSVKESREWITKFMVEKVLPHRVSVQWQKGDLAVFNNRRFMHSSTPTRFYTDNKYSSKRLLLQTFIPTKRPLLGVIPSEMGVYATYNLKWIPDQEKAIISAHNCIKYGIRVSMENNSTVSSKGIYVMKTI